MAKRAGVDAWGCGSVATVFFVWSRAPLLLRWTLVKASPMVMKHVEGALDVVVKDDDAVATVGQDEGTCCWGGR